MINHNLLIKKQFNANLQHKVSPYETYIYVVTLYLRWLITLYLHCEVNLEAAI